MGKFQSPGMSAGIWIPDRKLVRVEAESYMRIRGFVTTELRDANTGRLLQRLEFENLVTNAGLDLMGTNTVSGLFNGVNAGRMYFAAGTGNAAPANTDTTLQAEIVAGGRTQTDGSPVTSFGYTAGANDYHWSRVSRRFSVAQANGTIRELGMFNSSGAGVLFARALPKDSLGVPTAIVKDGTMTLDVAWQLRWYPPTADVLENVTVNGVTYALTYRPCNVGQAGGWQNVSTNGIVWQAAAVGGDIARYAVLATRSSAPAGATGITPTYAAYGAGNFHRDCTLSTTGASTPNLCISPGQGNGTGWAFMQFNAVPNFPAGQVFSFRQSWGRYP